MTKKKILDILDKIEVAVASLVLLVLICVTFFGVLMRYIFNNPFTWEEELQYFLHCHSSPSFDHPAKHSSRISCKRNLMEDRYRHEIPFHSYLQFTGLQPLRYHRGHRSSQSLHLSHRRKGLLPSTVLSLCLSAL